MAKLSRSIRREIENLVRTKGMSYQDAAIDVARGRAHKATAALHSIPDARYPRTELRSSQADLAQDRRMTPRVRARGGARSGADGSGETRPRCGILRTSDIAAESGISKTSLQRMVDHGEFPATDQLGAEDDRSAPRQGGGMIGLPRAGDNPALAGALNSPSASGYLSCPSPSGGGRTSLSCG